MSAVKRIAFAGLCLSIPQAVWSASYYRVNNGTNLDIAEWSVCRNVDNSNTRDLFVPTNTATEWSTFRSNLPGGVTLGTCGPCPAIDFVASSSADSNTSTLTVPLPAGTAINDVLLAKVSMRATNTATVLPTPSGWTKLGADILLGTGGGSNSQRTAVYYVVVTATEISAGSAVWSFAGNSQTAGGMAAYRNVDTVTPINTSSAVSYTANSTSIVPTQISTTSARAMVVALYAINNNLALTPPPGFTQRFAEYYSNRTATALSDTIQETAGPSGTPTVIIASNNNRRSIRLVALQQDGTCP
jgi:hypothetical protein